MTGRPNPPTANDWQDALRQIDNAAARIASIAHFYSLEGGVQIVGPARDAIAELRSFTHEMHVGALKRATKAQ